MISMMSLNLPILKLKESDKLTLEYETVSWSALGQTTRYGKEEDMVL